LCTTTSFNFLVDRPTYISEPASIRASQSSALGDAERHEMASMDEKTEVLLPSPVVAPSRSTPSVRTILYIFLNCVATIAVVFLNKM